MLINSPAPESGGIAEFSNTATDVQVMVFVAAGYRFCVRIEEVERLLMLSATDEIPGAPGWVLGLLNLAGESIPVVDFALRIGVEQTKPYSLDTPMVICRRGDLVLGLLVDWVQGIQQVKVLDSVDSNLPKGTSSMFSSVARDGEQSMFVVDLKEIFSGSALHGGRPVEAYLIPHARGSD